MCVRMLLCFLRRCGPGDSDLVTVAEWQGEWNVASGLAVVGDALVIAKGKGMYVSTN